MAQTQARKVEKEIIEELGANLHANSGAMLKKNDGSSRDIGFSIEVKTTNQKAFRIDKEYWKQVRDNAYIRDLEPVMIIQFDDGTRIAIIAYDQLRYYLDIEKNSEAIENSS